MIKSENNVLLKEVQVKATYEETELKVVFGEKELINYLHIRYNKENKDNEDERDEEKNITLKYLNNESCPNIDLQVTVTYKELLKAMPLLEKLINKHKKLLNCDCRKQ